MIKAFLLSVIGCVLAQNVCATSLLTRAQNAEMLAMVTNINHGAGLAYRAVVIQRMLAEANWAADQLKLPIKRPIQVTDIEGSGIGPAWFAVLQEPNPPYLPDTVLGTHIYDADIPREVRLRALKVGVDGVIWTTNFEFNFYRGRLLDVMRLSAPHVEYYATNLDDLIGKPSVIDTNGAYQLATQWLAVVDVDVAALEKQGGHSVNQLHYLARSATNAVALPLYYVDFGSRHVAASGNLKAFDELLVSVEILGTTKELQELTIGRGVLVGDFPYDHRPLLLITNALDLVRTPNPRVKQLHRPILTNSP
ncbi:MAG: hypothetical protein WAO21_04790 [Verrucomicrobiia bacterium]|jgi:hypothetical protein